MISKRYTNITRRKKPLRRSILIGTVLFILLLCAVLSVAHYQGYRRTLYSQYEARIADIHYIYIIEPLNTEETDNIRNVAAGATQYEYEYEADELVYLNMPTGDSYSPATAKKHLDAYQSDKLSFLQFE